MFHNKLQFNMTRIGLLVFLFSFGAMLPAQIPTDGLTLLHLMKCDDDLKGEVDNIVTTARYFNAPTVKIVLKYQYDENNRLLQYSERGSYFYTKSRFTYDKVGLLTHQINSTRNEILDSLVCKYDDFGRLKIVSIYSGKHLNLKSLDKINYDENDRPIKVRTGFSSGTRTQELFLKNNDECLIKHRIRGSNAKVAKVFNERYKYDASQHCLEFAERTIKNVMGQRTIEVFVDPESQLRVWVQIEYDKIGNWIKRTAFLFDEEKKKPKREKLYEHVRKIVYQSDRKAYP